MTDTPRNQDRTNRRRFLQTIGAAGLSTGTLATTAAAFDQEDRRTVHDLTVDELPEGVDEIATRDEVAELASSPAAEPAEKTIEVKDPKMAVKENRTVVKGDCEVRSKPKRDDDCPIGLYEKRKKKGEFKRFKHKKAYAPTWWKYYKILAYVKRELRDLLYVINGKAFKYNQYPYW